MEIGTSISTLLTGSASAKVAAELQRGASEPESMSITFSRKSSLLLCLLLQTALGASASVPSREINFPIAGEALSADGSHFYTGLWITNLSQRPASLNFEFVQAGTSSVRTVGEPVTLSPFETRRWRDVNKEILRTPLALGALRIKATAPITGTIRIERQRSDDRGIDRRASSFNGIPAEMAIGKGQQAVLQGVVRGPIGTNRYNLFLSEVRGHPLAIEVEFREEGRTIVGGERYVLHPFEQRTISVDALLPGITLHDGTATVKATSGPGRIVAAGARLDSVTGDTTPFEMSYDTAVPSLIRPSEWIPLGFAALVSLAIGLAAAVDQKKTNAPGSLV